MTDYIRDLLEESYPDVVYELKFDKTIGGCSLRRPDVFIDMLRFVIIIECDERQHVSYSCENKRIMEIFQDAGNRPIIFIRFNPDSYMSKEGRKRGCFQKMKAGGLKLMKTEWGRRTEELSTTLSNQLEIEGFPEKELTVLQLFYDEV